MTTNELIKSGVPLRAAIDFRTVQEWIKIGKKIDPTWMKRYNEIKTKYNLI